MAEDDAPRRPDSDDMVRRARERFGRQPDGERPPDHTHIEEEPPEVAGEVAASPGPEPSREPGGFEVPPTRRRATRFQPPDDIGARTTPRSTKARPRMAWRTPQSSSTRRLLVAVGWVGLVVFQVVRGGLSGTESLEVGDCFNSSQLTGTGSVVELTDVDVVACDEPHLGETFATVDYAAKTGGSFPGNPALARFAAERCAPEMEAFVDGDPLDSGFDLTAITPNEDGWEAGDRTIECTLVRLDGKPAPGSAEGVGRVAPEGLVSLLYATEGDCVDLSEWVAFGLPRECAEPHDLEVFAVLTSPAEPGAPYPSEEEMATYAFQSCAGAFQQRVDPSSSSDLGFAPVAFPLPYTWALGHRSFVCGLFRDRRRQARREPALGPRSAP